MIVISAAVVVGVAGAVGAFLSARSGGGGGGKGVAAGLTPAERDKQQLEKELVETKDALAAEKKAGDEMRAVQQVSAEQAAATTKQKDALAAVVSGQGEVTQDGQEIKLELVDKVLFRVGDDELTERGKQVLSRVGAALNAVPDKQIWVQGHTDDTPIRVTRPEPAKDASKGKDRSKAKGKAAKGVKLPEEPAPRFATNWELSSARALTVVHYLQTEAKVDPHRLAAVAFGEYRPASRVKAKNRRIEIVLYPRHSLK